MRRFFVRVRLLPYISLFAAAVVRIMANDGWCEIRMEFSYLCGDINLRNGKLLSFYHYPVQPEPLCAGQTRPAHRTDRWLEHRFEVFERYCLPSVAAQTSGNFTWLCLFDAATPEPYRSRIEGYKARCPQFEAVYYTAAQAANLTENLRTTITAYVSCDRKGRKSPPRSC